MLSVGRLIHEYPETNRSKPYQSILAIPLVATDERVIGALSIDSTRPYFFQSFTPGQTEDALENGLQPYLQLILLALEGLAGESTTEVIDSLCTVPRTDPPGERPR